MDEVKTENFGMDEGQSITGSAMPVSAPASMPTPEPVATPASEQVPVEMPTPAPMPAPESMPASPTPTPEPMEMSQPTNFASSATPEVERMEMPVDPVGQPAMSATTGGMTMQIGNPTEGGNKKIVIIVGVLVGALIVGVGAFFIWKSMNTPEPVAPVVEQIVVPAEVPQVVVETPPTPQPDDISVIEQGLTTFNVGGVDVEIQASLAEIAKAL